MGAFIFEELFYYLHIYKMKRWVLFACFFMPVFVFAQAEKATVKGALNGIKEITPVVYYTYRGVEEQVMDSTKVVAGKFSFTVEAILPAAVTLFAVDPDGDTHPAKRQIAVVYLQKGNNTVTFVDSFSNVKVKESRAHAEYLKLTQLAAPYIKQLADLSSTYQALQQAKDTAGINQLTENYEALENRMKENVYGSYVKENPNSSLAIYALNKYTGYDLDLAKVEPLYNGLSVAIKKSAAGKGFGERINIAKATTIGSIAPEFSQTDTSGKQVSLSSFRGKYVLIDFWASWCGPCRMENPNVVAAFNQYKDKNFTVLGVSLDDEKRDGRNRWITAIAKDKLTWTHVSDLKFWNNAVAKQYGIRAIPQNILIDPLGKIVAKNVTGEALHLKLAELLP